MLSGISSHAFSVTGAAPGCLSTQTIVWEERGLRPPRPRPPPTFPVLLTWLVQQGRGLSGMGGVWWCFGWREELGGAVSPTLIHHLGQNLGDGVECFHRPIELTSAHPKDYLLELQSKRL